LVFLHDPDVPPTNNHSEQPLRPAVITRKVGGCNKTLWGALVHGVLASLLVTCQRRGKRFLDLARRLWENNDPPAILLEALPGS
jgi:transposase